MALAPTSRLHWAGTYDQALDYAAGTVVLQGGALYRARLLRPHGAAAPADDAGSWDTLASAPAAPAGVPVLTGPYVVDYTDFGPSPMEGRTVDLWTPAVGDVLLHIFPDLNTLMQWDSGHLYIGQSPIVPNDPITNNPTGTSTYLTQANNGDIGLSYNGLDTLTSFTEAQAYRAGSPLTTVWICATTDPVQILLAGTGGTDPGAGHVEIYALVARAVAP